MVLIVEDDADARTVLRALVEALGHRALTAANAAEALDAAKSSHPEVALIDLGLPGMDGCEVARRLRVRHPPCALRLVALTGYSDPHTRRSAAHAGFDDFVVKPLDVGALGGLLAAPA